MTTVINNPGPRGDDNKDATSSGLGVIIGAVIVIVVLITIIILATPYFRERIDKMSQPPTVNNPTINIEVPLPTLKATSTY
jgi:hypothetical protein